MLDFRPRISVISESERFSRRDMAYTRLSIIDYFNINVRDVEMKENSFKDRKSGT